MSCDCFQAPKTLQKKKKIKQGRQVQFEEFQEHGGEKLCYQLLSCREQHGYMTHKQRQQQYPSFFVMQTIP